MFGIGLAELLIFLVIGLVVIGVPIAIIVLVVILVRRDNFGSERSPPSDKSRRHS